jgi:hypothetical protein
MISLWWVFYKFSIERMMGSALKSALEIHILHVKTLFGVMQKD